MIACRLCGAELLAANLLALDNMPAVAQNFPEPGAAHLDRGVALKVAQCGGCGLVQLRSEPVPYYRDVLRAAGISPEMQAFRRDQFSQFLGRFGLAGKRVLEVGCGRGEYATVLRDCGAEVYGLEHLDASVRECQAQGLQVSQGFLEDRHQRLPHGPFDGFLALNFLEHVPHPGAFLQGIATNLRDGGIGLVEVPNFDFIVREKLFTEFMSDHLFYFSADTLTQALRLNGFDVLECREVWHSYSLSAVVRKRPAADLSSFSALRGLIENELSQFLGRFPPLATAIWGAGHQALAVMAMTHLGGRIKYVVDSAPSKQGRLTPATHIPVVSPATLAADGAVQAVLVMGSSYTDEIVAQLVKSYRPSLAIAVLKPEGLRVVQGARN